ncbi:MAG: stage II sporulation protein P [Blautia glucerasea]|nr:stage II sporulation protein P [Blautia glucerasea]MDY3087419.1 stage II sporulation protein P [Blautia sp.]
MTKFQKGFCVILCLCFFLVLAVMPEPFSRLENIYRQFPIYRFAEQKARDTYLEADWRTEEKLIEENAEYVGQLLESTQAQQTKESQVTEFPQMTKEPQVTEFPQMTEKPQITEKLQVTEPPQMTDSPQVAETVQPHPVIDLSPEKLADKNYLLEHFFVVDAATTAEAASLNAAEYLAKDMTLKPEKDQPQILIYHSHSQETFADSRTGEEADTVVGVGDYLTEILEQKYGYQVIHVREHFDVIGGEIDRSRAYDFAREYVEKVLEENPTVQVLIDLHRDGVPEGKRLVTKIGGRDTAQIMFYNGLSYTVNQGKISYLPNPYIEENLAFSFQLEYTAAEYYPGFYRCIYLAGLRYNLHLRPRALLVEAGAQTNTVQEVKNAMEPLGDILNRVLKGSDK